MGSDYAKDIQLKDPDNQKWDEYEERLEKLSIKVASMEESEWKKPI